MWSNCTINFQMFFCYIACLMLAVWHLKGYSSVLCYNIFQRKKFGNSVRCYPRSLHPIGFCIFRRLIMGDDQLYLNLLPSIRFFLYFFIIQAVQFQSLGQTSRPTVWGISIDPMHSAKSGQPAGTSNKAEEEINGSASTTQRWTA